MIHLLRVTAFNLPRLTRISGIVLAWGLCAIYASLVVQSSAPGYLHGVFLVAAVAAFLAGGALLSGFRTWGWGTGAAVAVVGFACYLASRTVGLPGFAAATGAWHDALGTVSMLAELAFLAVYASVLVGWNIDVAGARDWDTYYTR